MKISLRATSLIFLFILVIAPQAFAECSANISLAESVGEDGGKVLVITARGGGDNICNTTFEAYVDGGFVGMTPGDYNCKGSNCSYDFKLPLGCMRTGTYTATVKAKCGRQFMDTQNCYIDAPGYASEPFFVNTTPEVFVEAGEWNPVTNKTPVTIQYAFPNVHSAGWRLRNLVLYGEGGGVIKIWDSTEDQFGTVSVDVEGCGEVTAVATACRRFNDEISMARDTTQLPDDGCKRDRNACDMPGRPVNYGSGDVSLDLPLFTIAQSPLPLQFSLSYHSARPAYSSIAREIAPGWTHSFNPTLRVISDGNVQLGIPARAYGINESGVERFYEGEPGSGTWTVARPADVHEEITRVGAELRLRDLNGTVRAFDEASGRWLSTTDRWNNKIFATYDAGGNLTAVTDSVGRVITILASGSRIATMTLPDGGVWYFGYDGNGQLGKIYDPLHHKPLLPPSIINSAQAFNADWAASFAQDGNLSTDYASLTLGANTFVDFDFGKEVHLTDATFTDRKSSGGANGSGANGPYDNVTAFNWIFSSDSTFGNGNDVVVPVTSSACCDTINTPLGGGNGINARYVRYDVTATQGANVGAAELSFSGTEPGSGLETSVGPWRTFTYQNDSKGMPRLLTAMRDEAGMRIEGHTYDWWDRGMTSFLEGNREMVTLEYNTPAAGKTKVTHWIDDTKRQVSIFTLQYIGGRYRPVEIEGGCGTCGITSDAEEREYDAAGNLTRRESADGTVTLQTFNQNGLPLTLTQAAGTAEERVTTYEYNHSGWPAFATRTTEPSAFGTRTITKSWSGSEDTLTTTIAGKLSAGGPTTALTTVTRFDGRHRTIEVDGPRTDVADVSSLQYHADNHSDVNLRGRVSSETNPANLTTHVDAYALYGTPISVRDENNVLTTLQVDGRGRTIATKSHAVPGVPGEGSDYTSTQTYDGRDRLIETVSAGGNRVRLVYEDGSDLLLDTVVLDASGNERERRHYTRNLIGSIVREELQSCSSPAPVCPSWTTTRTESYVYDTQNRRTEIVNADNSRKIFTYDGVGRVKTEQDENHSTPNTTYTYDRLGRVKAISRKLGSGAVVTQYTRDHDGRPISLTGPNGNVTLYEYDDFARRIKTTSPITGVSTWTYDASGNIIESTLANGNVHTMTWDAVGRVQTQTATRSGAMTETVTFTYDGNVPFGKGRLTSMTDPSGSTSFSYERRGHVKGEQRTIGTASYTTGYGYDANGNQTKVVYPSGRVVDTTFDYAARPYLATSGSTAIVSSTSYLPFGPIKEIVYGNGSSQTMTRNTRYRMERNRLTTSAGTVADYTYLHDGFGNITQIHDATDSAYNRDFEYDDLYRLTRANTGSALWGNGIYSYDAMGNMQSLTLGTMRNATFAHAGTTGKLTSVTENGTSRNVSYDAAGNEIAVGSDTFQYSARNYLAATGDRAYEYDGRGLRAATITLADSSRAFAIYSTSAQLIAETASGLAAQPPIEQEYVWFAGLPVAQFDGSTARWTVSDHLGTPFLQTDANGTVVWRTESEPFGSMNLVRAGSGLRQPLRFPGQENDGGELTYNNQRWYRAEWGRYTQHDPLSELEPDTSPFVYAAARPLTVSDRSGLTSYDGFNEDQERQMRDAVEQAIQRLKRTCCGGDNTPELIHILQNANFVYPAPGSLWTRVENYKTDCAFVVKPIMVFTNTVIVTPNSFRNNCNYCSLAEVVLHEANHLRWGDYFDGESPSHQLQVDCFQCEAARWMLDDVMKEENWKRPKKGLKLPWGEEPGQ